MEILSDSLGDTCGLTFDRNKFESSLRLLESMQDDLRRGREASAPYLASASQALQQLATVPSAPFDGRQHLLDSCAALETLVTMHHTPHLYTHDAPRQLTSS